MRIYSRKSKSSETPAGRGRQGVVDNSFHDRRDSASAQHSLMDMARNSERTSRQQADGNVIANANGPMQRKETDKAGNKDDEQNAATDELAGMLPAMPIQRQSNDTGLPDGLKSGIESLSGMSMDHVKVHYNSTKPAQLQAHAYAQGSEIHVGPGQERHLPHEAWHIVQQAQGRVKPTLQMHGDMPVNDDLGLEREADAMGATALGYTGYGANGQHPQQNNPRLARLRALRGVIQRKQPAGIENRANDCFLNALIHLIGAGYQEQFDPAARPWTHHGDVQNELWTVIQQVNAGGDSVPQATIGTLRERLHGVEVGRRGRVITSKGNQEDASEVLQHLLELTLVAGDQVEVEEEREYAKSEPDAAYTHDRSQLQTYTDKKARQTSRTAMIGVDIDQYASFHDFLYHEFGVGNVHTEFDAKNRYAILVGGNVRRVGEVAVRRRFVSLPPVLTFNLHRFRVGPDGGQQRINRRFAMPRELVLRSGASDAPRWEQFELQAFVVQHGGLSSGHYTAERLTDKGWLARNDDKPATARVEPDNIDTGYIYTYRSAGPLRLAPDKSLQDEKPEFTLRDLGDGHESSEESSGPEDRHFPEGKPSTARRGLPNVSGHDCFMNVALQMISGPLHSVFEHHRKHPVLDPIMKLAADIGKGGDKNIEKARITEMRELLLKHELVESETAEEDASELLLRLLNLAIRGKDQIRGQRVRSFEADARHNWTGDTPKGPADYTKGKSTEKMAPANSIPIDIAHFDTLEQFLALRFHEGITTFYDEANRPKVRQDNAVHALSAVKETHELLHLPDVLVFVLNRSIQDSRGWRRLDKAFFMPPTFTISEHRSVETQYRYRLTGIVMHTGSRDTGHYRAWMQQEQGGEWLQANDSNVTAHDDPGAEQHQGYLYTYRRIADAREFDTPVEQLSGLTASALLLEQVRAGNRHRVQQMLDSGGISAQAVDPASGKTALHAAVEADTEDEEMVRFLLQRGADPAAVDGERYSAIERAEALKRDGLVKLMRQSNMHDVGALAKDVKSFSGKDQSALARLYNRLSDLSETINACYGRLIGIDYDGAAVMVRLQHQLHQIRHDLNQHASAIHGVKLGGPGGRPDTHRVFTSSDDKDLGFYLAQLDKLNKGAKDAYVRCQAKASKKETADASKPISESLTAAYAQPMKGFERIGPWSGKGDLEYDVNGVGWDQKAMYVGQGESFAGRLHHTQTKSSSSTTEKNSEARNGLLLDATVTDPRNYELIWEKLFTSMNRGELDPKRTREVQSPLKLALKSDIVIDTTTREPRCNDLSFEEKSVSAVAELDALGGIPSDGIRVIAPPSWLGDEVKKLLAGAKSAYTVHTNDRHWLQGGHLYFEASASRGSKVKIVFDRDMTNFYVSCTHYKGYTIREASGLRFCHPFFAIDTTGLKLTASSVAVTVDEAQGAETATQAADSTPGTKDGGKKKKPVEPAKRDKKTDPKQNQQSNKKKQAPTSKGKKS
ncbi:Ankyrin repeat-containing protein [Collimonas sp. OK607]|uniref:eCIS core domain-containing protein n=1 Tax=Collimonas sp. OK607 TaxID=1798194 RepID=UPI0008DF8B93|nr:DUF4157 domain-containing protein [Collimonas sp. OK607]SFA98758.1 Ankyrin repeat-containing protein [Collimonas sp. OK607]